MLLLSGKIIGKLFIILCKFLKSYNPLGLKSSPTDIALLQKELKRLKAANLIMKILFGCNKDNAKYSSE
ncbi:MAG: hypothetical protein Q8N12_00110 [Thermodesulfovibrionales bacterium]|nr:hypothetical protein [Nitrospirota bacterium]MDP3047824.1 hypothetical protein [Thermodesulfovibrionales bacterium]